MKEEIKALAKQEVVCLCMDVNMGELIASIKEGNSSLDTLMEDTDAGTACQLCQSCELDEDGEREIHLDEVLKAYTA